MVAPLVLRRPVAPRFREKFVSDGQGEQLIKSKGRVKKHGEVFTPATMVDQMLDLVDEKLAEVDATFLEPAAGDGNFLVRILERKLAYIERTAKPADWQLESLHALASIYGVELLTDNHADAQTNMLDVFTAWQRAHGTQLSARHNLYRAAQFLIDTNIICGNFLTGQKSDGAGEVEFSWWRRTQPGCHKVRREAFTLNSLRRRAQNEQDMFDLFATGRTVYTSSLIDEVHKQVAL